MILWRSFPVGRRSAMDIEKKNVKNIYPLSPMQEGLLFHSL